jgi:hypothetical protein
MSRRSLITVTVLFLAICVSALAGCGGGTGEVDVTEQEQLVDNMLREAAKGNIEPLMELVPPGYEQYVSEFTANAAQTIGNIKEIYYRTEVIDEDRVIVYFWGTFEYEQDGEVYDEVIGEDEATPVNMKRIDGTWYLDFGPQPGDTGSDDTSTEDTGL